MDGSLRRSTSAGAPASGGATSGAASELKPAEAAPPVLGTSAAGEIAAYLSVLAITLLVKRKMWTLVRRVGIAPCFFVDLSKVSPLLATACFCLLFSPSYSLPRSSFLLSLPSLSKI